MNTRDVEHDALIAAVLAGLAARGIDCDWDYPGYFSVYMRNLPDTMIVYGCEAGEWYGHTERWSHLLYEDVYPPVLPDDATAEQIVDALTTACDRVTSLFTPFPLATALARAFDVF